MVVPKLGMLHRACQRLQPPCQLPQAGLWIRRTFCGVWATQSGRTPCLRNEKAQTCCRTGRWQRFGRDWADCCLYRLGASSCRWVCLL